ncbi:site-specific integrase, partial [Candidatus Bathyarchaeota archaeon]|nr:site-specific integrase [Candidatus Bathyarchaeota archaeon]
IGEALQLTLEDLDFTVEPVKVSIRAGADRDTKTGDPRIAFISTEAKEAVEAWLRVRDDYLRTSSAKSHLFKKSSEDSRLFPFLSNTARQIWSAALQKSGLLKRDATTKRRTLHPHSLRKYFRTRLGAVIPVDIVEALQGHEGYLTQVYRKYSEQELGEFYRKGEPFLSVFSNLAEISKLKSQIEEKNQQLQTVVNSLAIENVQLKAETSLLNERLLKAESQSKDFATRFASLYIHLNLQEQAKGLDLGTSEKAEKGT